MMAIAQTLRGTRDILPPETRQWQWAESQARALFERYGYHELRTPLLEEHQLFVRSIGTETDIVQKELFAFADKGERMVCLRPEATASAVRAYLEHHLDKEGRLVKWYYLGPMFRAEKPQAGRHRQFHQFGIEAIGSLSPTLDAEVILLSCQLLQDLQISLDRCAVKLNNLGCQQDKEAYQALLAQELHGIRAKLCDDCHRRLARNPWRVLDCKQPPCREAVHHVLAKMKSSAERVCTACQAHYQAVLDLLKVAPEVERRCVQEPFLVRGLDYYTRTVFEITHAGLGAQDAVCGGGRYDTLVEACGGPSTGAIGVAFGEERLLLAMEQDRSKADATEPSSVFVAVLKPELYAIGLNLMQQLRAAGMICHADYDAKSLKSQLRFADKLGARWVVILGEDEAKAGTVSVKDFSKHEPQSTIPQAEVVTALKKSLAESVS